MFGQPYKIHLDLEMPESPTNKELGIILFLLYIFISKRKFYIVGMFMVCADFRGKYGKLITHSCRSAMLHYKSSLLHTIHTLLFSPFFLFGTAEEKQHVTVELFTEFQEDEVHIEIV